MGGKTKLEIKIRKVLKSYKIFNAQQDLITDDVMQLIRKFTGYDYISKDDEIESCNKCGYSFTEYDLTNVCPKCRTIKIDVT